MRDLINIIDMLENTIPSTQLPNMEELEAFKSIIASKIKELPDDAATAKALKEIEDLLKYVHAGGKTGIIAGKLQAINDPTVTAAQKELSRYILSIDMDPRDRDQMFDLWRENKLVKIDVLLGKGRKSFNEIITNYNTNPAIRELSNDLMRIAALGQGKGEFGLSVMSKSINKQDGKGDLNISGRPIEVKTTDGGAGRFTDQEVRPGPGFEQAARKLDAFLRQYQPNLAKSGANLDGIVQFYEVLATNPDMKQEANTYLDLVSDVIQRIFEGMDIDPIMAALKRGDVNTTKQEYAKTNFNYYMAKKKDEGVLYISLVKDPIMTVFFKNADELAASGLRLHAGTIYITSVSDVRLPYPQLEIVSTSSEAPTSTPAAPALTKNKEKNPVSLDTTKTNQRLIGPGAAAAKNQEPKMTPDVLGRLQR